LYLRHLQFITNIYRASAYRISGVMVKWLAFLCRLRYIVNSSPVRVKRTTMNSGFA